MVEDQDVLGLLALEVRDQRPAQPLHALRVGALAAPEAIVEGALRGGTDSAEWYVLAIEYAGPLLVAAGHVAQADLDAALAQARRPEFAIQSPLAVACWGRKPGP